MIANISESHGITIELAGQYNLIEYYKIRTIELKNYQNEKPKE